MSQRPIHEIEAKWQARWEEEGVYRAGKENQKSKIKNQKFYGLIEFPYPSGEGLHVGHPRPYTAIDIVTRKRRMEGKDVLYPIGWDAFGLPTENFAIKNKIKPAEATQKNIANFKRQIKSIGFGFDWSREIDTTDPAYYKWTQWQFLQFFKHGLAYKAKSTINWCPKDKIGLANEEAQGGVCERCGTPVEKREKEQWMIRITKYAERLLKDLDTVDYLDKIKAQQINWIGKSEGAEVSFRVPRFERVLAATNNKSKVARVKKLMAAYLPGVEVVTPGELGLAEREVVEGDDLAINAQAKAKAYETDLPVLGMDTGLFIEGERLNPSAPKRNALGGRDEADMTQEEKAQAMDEFYRGLAKKRGGEVEAYWKDMLVLRLPDGSELREEAIRPVVITDKRVGEMDNYFPVRGLYRVKATGKYVAEQTEEEEIYRELAPLGQALAKLLSETLTVFTTRPDTLFGATYLVVAPEHEVVNKIKNQKSKIKNIEEVEKYVELAKRKADVDRTAEGKEKTGVELKGVSAINPVNGERIPIWVADYVLAGYGTGAIMAVPAHDERDFEFAKKFGLEIKQVVAPLFLDSEGKDAIRSDRPTVRRKTINAFVKHKKEDKYLCLDWKGFGWHSGIIGGVDEGEDAVTAAMREVREETGYQNLRLVRELGEVHNHFFAAHKNENRYAVTQGFVFELFDEERQPVEEKNTKNHDVVWINTDQLSSFFNLPSFEYYWNIVQGSSECFSGNGVAIRSDFLDDLPTWKASQDMVSWLEEHKKGERAVTYKLRDWVFSRQRYWGEPIPIVHCATCALRDPSGQGYVPVPDEQLPVVLPDVEAYEPTDTGESPLAKIREWVETTCPKCGGPAERETDTMPNWAGSSWYFLRYCDPQNEQALADPSALKYWMPVDLYNGGMEHTTLHLLYSRFWYKFLWDIGVVPKECGSEPYRVRRSHGLIMASDGQKMSKSRGNVVNPDDVIEKYGADVFRVYEMFMGPFDQPVPWDMNGIEGVRRFLDKVWGVFEENQKSEVRSQKSETETLYNQTVKKVSEGIDNLQFNTCVSQLMILTNAFMEARSIRPPDKGVGGFGGSLEMMEGYLKLLAPFAPHLAEEIWRERLGHQDSIHCSAWPTYDSTKLQAETFELVIQVNGKVRDRIQVTSTISEEEAKAAALASEKARSFFVDKKPAQVVYVKGKLVNVVV